MGRIKYLDYLKSVFLIAFVSLLGAMLRHSIAQTNLAMFYILVVVITAVRWGRGPSLFAAILSVLIFDFFFIPPKFSMTVADTQYLIAFGTLFVVALVISSLTLKAKEEAQRAGNREIQATALYNLSKDLANVLGPEELYRTAVSHIGDTFHAEAAIFLKEGRGIKMKFKSPGFPLPGREDEGFLKSLGDEKDIPGGKPLLKQGRVFYTALRTSGEVFGALGIMFNDDRAPLGLEQSRLLEAFVNQTALTIERLRLLAEVQQAELLRQAEKLQTAFLNSVSHDLRTPLSSITGSLSVLLQGPRMSEKDRHSLMETAYRESSRLNQLVSDLLDMARVEAGALYLQRKPAEARDLIGTALKKTEDILKDFRVNFRVSGDLPEIEIDFLLMMKVLTNVLHNAAKYSAAEKEIGIEAEAGDGFVRISISDRGIGIPPADLKQVFNKFYRISRPQQHEGTGLGLSVCKGIVEAHQGAITAENRPEGGTIIRITIPSRRE